MSPGNFQKWFKILIEYSLIFLVISTPLIFSSNTFELFEFPKILFVYAGSSIIFVSFILDILIQKKVEIRKTILLIPLLLYLASQVISSIISIDPHTSLFGYYSRFNGGLLSQISYVLIFIISISYLTKSSVIKVLNAIVICATIVAIWGIPSHFGIDPTCKLVVGNWSSDCWSIDFDPKLRIFATLGQPNWLAAYLAMVIPVSLSFLLFAKNLPKKIFFLISFVLQYFAFILTNSRAASLGLVIGMVIFFLLLLLAFKKEIKIFFRQNFTYFLVITILLFGITFFFGQRLLGRVKEARQTIAANSQVSQPSTQTALVSQGTESGKIRFIVWRGAVEIFKNYPLIGSGVETFAYSYYNFRPIEHNSTTEWNFLYNKAHNEYLNYLATTGIIGFLSYLTLIGTFLFLTVKYLLKKNENKMINSEKIIIVGLVSGYSTYLIQNFFGFSVVAITLLFFLYMAFAIVLLQKRKEVWELALHSKFGQYLPVLSPIVIAFGFLMIIFTIRIYLADVAFSKGKQYESLGATNLAITKFQDAVRLSPASEPLFLSNLANASAQLATSVEDGQDNLKNVAIDSSTKALIISPQNQTILRQTAETYLYLSFLDPKYADKSIEILNLAQKYAPTDPDIPYQKAIIYNIIGNQVESIESLEESLKLKPDLQKAKDKLAEYQSESNQ